MVSALTLREMRRLHETKPRTRGRHTGESSSVAVHTTAPFDRQVQSKMSKAGGGLHDRSMAGVDLERGPQMDVEDLIERLCVAAGMIMEDANVGAISTGSEPRERVLKLLHASEAITALARAAVALKGLSQDPL